MQHLQDYEIEDLPVKQIKRKFEPKNAYEFCQVFASITKRPIGLFLKATKNWPIHWFIQVQSECKEKTREKQAITINWWIRESQTKETK